MVGLISKIKTEYTALNSLTSMENVSNEVSKAENAVATVVHVIKHESIEPQTCTRC